MLFSFKIGLKSIGQMTQSDRTMLKNYLAAAYFLVITLFLLIDPVFDLMEGDGWLHVSLELVFAAITLSGLIYFLFEIRLEKKRSSGLRHDLDLARNDAEKWQAEAEEALKGLGEAIDKQFQRWQLSPAERDVGFYLLKGLSHKEIALIRETSERTVRQQSQEIYRKASISGRAELSAWFLEDLLQPGKSVESSAS